MRIYLTVLFSWLATGSSSFAAKKGNRNWCFDPEKSVPCGGAAGRCVKNSDGSKGGFVADAATREKRKWFGITRKAYIDRFSAVCGGFIGSHVRIEGASVVHSGTLRGHVTISNQSLIDGNSLLDGTKGKVMVANSVIRDSHILNRAVVKRAEIFQSTLKDDAKVNFSSQMRMGGRPTITHSLIAGKATVSGDVGIYDSTLSGSANVGEDAIIRNSELHGNADVTDQAEVWNSTLTDNAKVYGNGIVLDYSHLSGNASVHGNGAISRRNVSGDTQITTPLLTEFFYTEVPQKDQRLLPSNPSCEVKKQDILAEIAKSNLDAAFEILKKESGNSRGQVDTLADHFCKSDNRECPVCFNPFEKIETVSLPSCGHLFCHNCTQKIFQDAPLPEPDPLDNRPALHRLAPCPYCRREMDSRTLLNVNRAKKVIQGPEVIQ